MTRYRTAALGLLSAAVLGAALGHCRGLRSGMAIGYAYGDRDGKRRGDARARLDHVLAQPTETEHYAGVTGNLGDSAQDSSLAFAEALLRGELREHVGEDVR